jgi:hypothetical protein
MRVDFTGPFTAHPVVSFADAQKVNVMNLTSSSS